MARRILRGRLIVDLLRACSARLPPYARRAVADATDSRKQAPLLRAVHAENRSERKMSARSPWPGMTPVWVFGSPHPGPLVARPRRRVLERPQQAIGEQRHHATCWASHRLASRAGVKHGTALLEVAAPPVAQRQARGCSHDNRGKVVITRDVTISIQPHR